MKAIVTGGAGFIGSHLVDRLINDGKEVRVIDNLSSGSMKHLSQWGDDPMMELMELDLLDKTSLDNALKGCDEVYHLAANPEVNAKNASPEDHFRQNIEATYNLLEAMRRSGEQRFIAFTSSSTVYGEADAIPTREDYGPLVPISLYGASKLSCEALLTAYASMYGFRAIIYRLANVVGPRSNHGVIYDFVHKLRASSGELEVLGDGSQSKSYLYVDDCISGILKGIERGNQVDIYNIGSWDRTNVLEIAETVKDEMGLAEAKIRLTGGVDGGRGWKGDVKIMQLDMEELKSVDWTPKYGSAEAVRLTARSVIEAD
ncbi:NAD-dependent epimerase/dehydratase family protein [Candidatus Bathyarchaeota archaeon]|jgi:UDP-glucose 4-epimerase|nr:NAD-dependent epimerase/dehydratase family protein [Candidatus Bathyarchaeota archaeon]MBT4319225.1 NAD-dependent epimerase/dehydratase family protein [Candidatus Bathyarchaeota archaeon]MBT4423024.1 NAD-dependent epimerase/dehydratase family protein [Candidatus Bathyarchaeota archaeon]MBT5643112.1 NAD-dependent epimerase/dehydratase family protein [Candidatus Bathyarchaeota archaeon]MBT6605208.1 NAD-dependent epimerase/dehydratase family protein [Candidatus Bathyarchaeota archaeon]